jgi:hypothetical protein
MTVDGGFDWLIIRFIKHFTARDYTQITVTHRQMSSVTLLVTASNGRRSPASGLTSLQGGDHLTPISHSDRWLQPVLLLAARSRAGLTSNCQPPTSAASSRLASELVSFQLPKILGTVRIENTASNSSIVSSRSCRTDRVENISSQLVHWCVLGICCLAMDVFYRVII